MGSRSSHLWNGSWLPSILCRSTNSDLWEDSVWKGEQKTSTWRKKEKSFNLKCAAYLCFEQSWCWRSLNEVSLLVSRSDFLPTSAPTWRICCETCFRWIWPNVTATWRMESMTSRATNGFPQQTGSLSTRERQDTKMNFVVTTVFLLKKQVN